MAHVTVTAKRQFHYGGRDQMKGSAVKMTVTDAVSHARKGNVSLSVAAPAYRTTAMTPAPAVPEPSAPPAAPVIEAPVPASPEPQVASGPGDDHLTEVASVEPITAPPAAEPAPTPSPSPDAQRRGRRTYRRRDLNAEKTPTE